MNNLHKKALNFDLDTKSLKKYYPGKNYRQAYMDIKTFLLKSGFIHRQWSGYITNNPIKDSELRAKILKLRNTFPWLKKCVKRFDVTDIGRQHDLTYIITGKPKTKVRTIEAKQKHQGKATFSMQNLKKLSNKLSIEKQETQNQHSKKKDFER